MALNIKIIYAYIIELPQLGGGVCVMNFLHISNRLAVKHKKNVWPLGGAAYQKNKSPQKSTEIFPTKLVL